MEDDSFKKHTLLQGEIHTGTGLILEKDAMVEGEVWGDKHDKQDKFNEQVKYSNVSKALFSKWGFRRRISVEGNTQVYNVKRQKISKYYIEIP